LKLLVTGGAGFIGSNFVNQAIRTRRNFEVTVLDLLTPVGRESNLSFQNPKLRLVRGDIRDTVPVDGLVSESDLVINFAAESHNDNSLKTPLPFVETNVLGTYNLIQACVKHDVRYHHISTDEVFGDLPLTGTERFTTDTPYNPSSPYSATKAASDLLVRAWVRSFGLRATISNCSNNYGPNQHEEKFIPRTILLAASGIRPKVYGNGANVRDWIHVDDHNDGVWAVIEKGRVGETYLLGANGERTNLQVVQAILKELDLPEDFIEFVPDRPGHDLRYAIDASKAREELGWEPKHTSFEKGLKSVVAHYAELARGGEIDISTISGPGPSTSV
jgi:dTDP-glucose 4,6-dehydratase